MMIMKAAELIIQIIILKLNQKVEESLFISVIATICMELHLYPKILDIL